MPTRTNANVQVGQTWQSSDPRRLSAFRVIDLTSDVVLVDPIYPRCRPQRGVRLDAFLLTGTKGYTRLS